MLKDQRLHESCLGWLPMPGERVSGMLAPKLLQFKFQADQKAQLEA